MLESLAPEVFFKVK